MSIGCVAIKWIPDIKVYIKYKIDPPNRIISIAINFLFIPKYHLINLLLKKLIILSILIYKNIFNNKTIINPIIRTPKIYNIILKS